MVSAEQLGASGCPLESEPDLAYGGALLYGGKGWSYNARAEDGTALKCTVWKGSVIFSPLPPPPVQKKDNAARFNSLTAAGGSSFSAPLLIGTAGFTFAPADNLFAGAGFDAGLVSGIKNADYFSLYPYVHAGYFSPFAVKSGLRGGWYAGAGGGYMFQTWIFTSGEVKKDTFAVDAVLGVLLWDWLDLSYTLRTNFESANHKGSVGFVYRFK